MRKFIKNIIKFSLVGLIALSLILLVYLLSDPFKVIFSYKDYSYPYVTPNRDIISTEMFIRNKNKYNYNSFIFGSSRTLAYKPSTWKKYINKNDAPFLFDANGESIYGIYKKIKYLESINANINNAIVIICRDVTFNQDRDFEGRHLFIKHPVTSGNSLIKFHETFFKAYLNPRFLISFYGYNLLNHKYKDWMRGCIESRKFTYDTITNEFNIIDQEIEITTNPSKYYLKRKNIFYKREGEKTESINRINELQLQMLHEINRIFNKHKTRYKIVISPTYDQVKFSKRDFNILKGIFHENLYDFSGKNVFTDSYTNYYEDSHYRPNVGDSIFSIIYTKKD